MVVNHLALVLAKLLELHEHYQRYMPVDCRQASRALVEEVRKRNVMGFRNTVVGHVWDRAWKRPLLPPEVNAPAREVVKGDSEAFFRWMRNPRDQRDAGTVMGTVGWLLERMRAEYGFTAADLGLEELGQES